MTAQAVATTAFFVVADTTPAADPLQRTQALYGLLAEVKDVDVLSGSASHRVARDGTHGLGACFGSCRRRRHLRRFRHRGQRSTRGRTGHARDLRRLADGGSRERVPANTAVRLVRDGENDVEYRHVPQTFTQVGGTESDLKATKDGEGSWQFRTMDAAAHPFLGFGVGTVGNARLPANGFTPSIVGPPGKSMLNFGIFHGGDLDPKGTLADRFLVSNRATFQFKGVSRL